MEVILEGKRSNIREVLRVYRSYIRGVLLCNGSNIRVEYPPFMEVTLEVLEVILEGNSSKTVKTTIFRQTLVSIRLNTLCDTSMIG